MSVWDGKHENRKTIPGYIVGGGLSCHRTWVGGDRFAGTWDVTHNRTGLRIGGYFPTRQRAVEFAKDCQTLADWTQPGVTLTATVGLAGKVEKLLRQYRGLGPTFIDAHVGSGTDLKGKSTQ